MKNTLVFLVNMLHHCPVSFEVNLDEFNKTFSLFITVISIDITKIFLYFKLLKVSQLVLFNFDTVQRASVEDQKNNSCQQPQYKMKITNAKFGTETGYTNLVNQ